MNKPIEPIVMNPSQAWDRLARPPKEALKQIRGGRLSGMTDVNPQWRYKAMHDVFGPVGEGWKYQIENIWTEPGLDGQVFMFARVMVWVKSNGGWSDPIPGIGGSMLLEKDKNGIHHNDESPKMAVTDALSVALKMLGVAADIYAGRWDGTKYKDDEQKPHKSVAKETADKMAEAGDVRLAKAQEAAAECLACLPDEMAFFEAYEAHKSQLDADTQVAMWALLYGDNSPFANASQVKKALANGRDALLADMASQA